ncbi:MAG: hypothetical protein AB7F43_03100 [Bacteriovoracia bacterium]
MPKKKIVLYIRVYQGGDLWKKRYQHNSQYFDLFDEVIIRLGTCEMQQIDRDTIGIPPSNTRVIVQSPDFKEYNAIMGLDESSCDYIFFLCHDDILQPEGTKEILDKLRNSEERIAFTGGLAWTGDDNLYPYRVRLGLPDEGVAPADFFLMDSVFSFPFNLSGIAVPVDTVLEGAICQIALLSYNLGHRADSMYFISDKIDRIYENKNISVLIYQHSGQAGKIKIDHIREASNCAYFLIAALIFRRREVYAYSSRKILFLLRRSPYGVFLGLVRTFKVVYQRGIRLSDLVVLTKVFVLVTLLGSRKVHKLAKGRLGFRVSKPLNLDLTT